MPAEKARNQSLIVKKYLKVGGKYARFLSKVESETETFILRNIFYKVNLLP